MRGGTGGAVGRLSRAIGATLLGQLFTVGMSFLLVPLALRQWGAGAYGEWLTLSALAGCLTLFDFGAQSYVTNRICQAYARGSVEQLHRDLHSALLFLYALPVIAFGLLMAVVAGIPVNAALHFQATGREMATLTLLLLSANTLLLAIPQGLMAGVYRATGANARGTMVGNVFRLIQLVVSITVLSGGGSMTALAASWVAINIVSGAVIVWDLRRIRPDVRIGIRLGSLAHGASLAGPSLLFLMLTVAATVNTQGTLLIVNGFLGGVVVAQFATLRVLANALVQGANVLTAAVWPELTALEATASREELGRVVRSFVRLSVTLTAVGAVLVKSVGPDFYILWTQRQIHFDAWLLDVLLIQVVLMSFWSSSAVPLLASNRHRTYAWWMVANAAMTVGFSLLLIHPFGVVGVALGSLLADVCCGLAVVPLLVGRLLGEPTRRFVKSTFVPGVTTGLATLALVECLRPWLVTPALRVVVLPPLVAGCSLMAVRVFGVFEEELRVLRRFVGWTSVFTRGASS